jgi:hypothetical protein
LEREEVKRANKQARKPKQANMTEKEMCEFERMLFISQSQMTELKAMAKRFEEETEFVMDRDCRSHRFTQELLFHKLLDDIKGFMKYCKYEIRLDQSDHEYDSDEAHECSYYP